VVIAIDGPAGAGKSSVARALASRLGFTYLDSGAMYRCVALGCIESGVDPDDPAAAAEVASRISIDLDGPEVRLDGRSVTAEIRTPEVTEAASRVSVHPAVRETMVDHQRVLIAAGRYVAEGRDIGTVVSPESPLKVFLTASPEVRAERRAAEEGVDPAEVLERISERDERDSSREHGTLAVAGDAVEIDTSALDLEAVVDRIAALADQRGLS
jgi:cytidylate kinase